MLNKTYRIVSCGGLAITFAAAALLSGCQMSDELEGEEIAFSEPAVEVYGQTPEFVEGAGDDTLRALVETESTSWVYPFNPTSWTIGFNIYNGYLSSWSSCFQTSMSNLKHAGQDWAGSSTQVVAAIGDGTVVYAANANYPGYVVVIEHALSSAERSALGISSSYIYSMYGHLDAPYVGVGNTVSAGQAIGDLYYQGSNTHLHWEVRTFDISTLCATWYPGPGYTGPGTNATSYGYMHPSNSVAALQGAGNGGGSGCTCYDGLDFNRRQVDPADTHCGFRVCGTTYTLFECGTGGWTNLNASCGGGCTCYEGIDSSGRAVDPADTHCGYRVCGLDNQYYDCQNGGWVGSAESCQ
ncbi:M23 family metallopeptidase [Haliangium ochraceum]|uniref:Peptidase M23 n=1 Tax=Haliangium ochraceum (strain DSM 14365 / JCM 11303 / SMP-2) TaxID=502025 RepID=D0LVY0_HALO1|nr:M23 family metallopeptidase [Haliangium ochraceum]ACY14114.1 Peptidase M23 [Haliangium ochraceum DSM 14365]